MPPPRYPSNLSDQEWEILQPLLSSPEKRSRPPKWPLQGTRPRRRFLLAQERMFVADYAQKEYPPWQTV